MVQCYLKNNIFFVYFLVLFIFIGVVVYVVLVLIDFYVFYFVGLVIIVLFLFICVGCMFIFDIKNKVYCWRSCVKMVCIFFILSLVLVEFLFLRYIFRIEMFVYYILQWFKGVWVYKEYDWLL